MNNSILEVQTLGFERLEKFAHVSSCTDCDPEGIFAASYIKSFELMLSI